MSHEPDSDVNELDALTALVASDGWRLFVDACQQTHGHEACVRAIDLAIGEIPAGEREAIHDTVTNIRYAARAVDALVRWPQDRIAALTQPKKPTHFLHRRRVVS